MPQLIAPLIAPALGSIGIGTAGVTIASNIIVYAATTAASMLIQMAMQPKQQDPGTKLHAASGGAVNQSIIIGQKETAGSLIYAGSWGKAGKTPNGYYTRVYCMQDMPSSGFLSRCWTSDNKGTIDLDHINYSDDTETDYPADGSGYSGSGYSMGHPITSLDHDGLHYAWVKILDGSQTVADPFLREQFGGLSDRPWKSTMIGRGRTLMIVTQLWTSKEANEEKNVVVCLGGIPLYDWRNDSTNGGSGSQRWGTPSTYGGAGGNPIVAAYNIMRGIYQGGEWVYGGKNWPARRFDHDTWTAAANACDEDITLGDGSTEKRFRMGAEINLTEDPLVVLDRIFTACGARLVESGGVYKVYVGGIGASVYSFKDSDVILTEALTGKMFPTREEICNTITGTYCEPSNGGQMKAFRKRFKASYITEDGGETRSKDMTFDYVRSNTQAQRLALHALNDNRRFATKLVALPALSRKLEPGDTVNWSASDRFGYVNKKWIVGDVTFTRYGVVFVALREADATDSDWSVSDENAYTVGVYGDIRPATQVIALTATAHGVLNDAGTFKQPGIKITWPTDREMVDCRAVRWQVRPFGQEIIDRGRVEFDEGEALIKSGILRNGTYQVRAKIIPYSDRDTDYCAWITVVADNYGAISDDDTDDTLPNVPGTPSLTPFIRTFESGESVLKLLASWSPSSGLSNKGHYIVFVDDGDSVEKYVADDGSHSTSFRIRSGIPIAVYVRAVNGVGKKSNASGVVTATYSKKAVNTDAAAGLAVTTGFRKNVLKWTKAAQADHKWTAVYRRTTAGPGAWALLDTVKGTRFIDDSITPGTNYDYKIKHVDTSDNEGPDSNVEVSKAAVLIVDDDADPTAPAVVAAPTLTLRQNVDGDGVVNSKIFATWPAPASTVPIKYYEVRVSDGTDTHYHKTKNLSFMIHGAVVGKTYTVTISAISAFGYASAFTNSTAKAVTGRSLSLPDPNGMFLAADVNGGVINWDNVASDLTYAYTQVQWSTTSNSSGFNDLGFVVGFYMFFPYLVYGTNAWVRIRHVDKSNNKTNWVVSPNWGTGGMIPKIGLSNMGIDSVDSPQIVVGAVLTSRIADHAVSEVTTFTPAGSTSTTACTLSGLPTTSVYGNIIIWSGRNQSGAPVTDTITVGTTSTIVTLQDGDTVTLVSFEANNNASYTVTRTGTWSCTQQNAQVISLRK